MHNSCVNKILWVLLFFHILSLRFAWADFIWPETQTPIRIDDELIPAYWRDGVPYVERDRTVHLFHIRSGPVEINLIDTLLKLGYKCKLSEDGCIVASKMTRQLPHGNWVCVASNDFGKLYIDVDSITRQGPDRIHVIEAFILADEELQEELQKTNFDPTYSRIYFRDRSSQGGTYSVSNGIPYRPSKASVREYLIKGTVYDAAWEFLFNEGR